MIDESEISPDYPLRGLVGLYALSMMDKGPIYGIQVAHQIAERTEGTWNLGAGALYPTLSKLVRMGWAAEKKTNGRKVYTITKPGQKLLSAVRSGMNFTGKKYVLSWRLIFDLVQPEQRSEFVLQRFRTILSAVTGVLENQEYNLSKKEKEYLITQMIQELEAAIKLVKRHEALEVAR